MRLYLSGHHGGHQVALDSDRLRLGGRCDWSVGVPGVECGIRAAVDCGYGRPVRCLGPVGPHHTYYVYTRLLEDMAERSSLLPLCWNFLLYPGLYSIHHVPCFSHIQPSVNQGSKEFILVLRMEFHVDEVGLPAWSLLIPIQERVC